MKASEKVAYLKGMAEGLGVKDDTPEGKLMHAMVDMLGYLATDIEDFEANMANMAETINEMSEDIAYVEDLALDGSEEKEYECDGECSDCGECADCDEYEETQEYEITCPECGKLMTVCESELELGSVRCPSCGADLELDIEAE